MSTANGNGNGTRRFTDYIFSTLFIGITAMVGFAWSALDSVRMEVVSVKTKVEDVQGDVDELKLDVREITREVVQNKIKLGTKGR